MYGATMVARINCYVVRGNHEGCPDLLLRHYAVLGNHEGCPYRSINIRIGSSSKAFTFTRKVTEVLPSITRWS